MRYITLGVLFLLAVAVTIQTGLAEERQGISATKPASGLYVETDQGFMVPYSATIPGTSATYEMVPIPGGTFTMGSPDSEDGRDESEGPQFEVKVEPFWMGKYEVRWAQYREFMDLYGIFKDLEARNERKVTEANRIDAITAPTELYDPSFTFEFGDDPDLPAVTMTQYAARQYTKWVSAVTGHFYRLPSEAEWEYACRAGTQTAYFFGDDADELDDYAWYYDNSDDEPHKVGEKKPSPWGLYDIHGNVAEWVLDQKLEDGYERFAGKKLDTSAATVWPTQLTQRVIKGGSWEDDPENCRSAARLGSEEEEWKQEDPNLPYSPWWFTSDPTRGVGFRVIRPLAEDVPRAAKEKFWDEPVEDVKDGVENRLSEGRGALGLVDKDLPKAIKQLREN